MEEPITTQPAGSPGAETIHLPRPTMWPAVMALGITMFMAGLITNLAFTLAGLIVFLIALAGWIAELRHG